MSQLFTIGLTIFYVLWLCAVLFFLYWMARAMQKAANAIHVLATERRGTDNGHTV